MTDLEKLKKFILIHIERLKPLFKKTRLAYWNATTTGKKEFYKEYERLQKEIERIYNSKEEFEKVKFFLNSEIKEPLLKRQVEILYHAYLGSQGDIKLIEEIVRKSAEIERKFNIFRAKIGDKKFTDNEIKEILRIETDSKKLKEAWEASKEQGALVVEELIELIKLRNQLARNLGFANYYELSLEVNEQNKDEIEQIFEQLDKLTETPLKLSKKEVDCILSKRYKIQEIELKPWHYQDLFFQEAPDIYNLNLDKYYNKDIIKIAVDFYKKLGLPVEDILARSDLYEKPKKEQHAYCLDINRGGDIRMLENIKNNEWWVETTLHELGHAVYYKFIDKKLPFLLRDPAHILTTEAIAQLFGKQPKNITFVRAYCELKDKELAETLNKYQRLRQLIFSSWSQVMFNFERNLYQNPEQDLNKLWWDLVKKYQLIDFSRDKPDWASKIHLVSAPVYYHNYLLGELLASQLQNYMTKNILNQNPYSNIDYSGKKELGNYLKEKIFKPGARYKWQELIKKATKEPLTTKYYVEEFCKI